MQRGLIDHRAGEKRLAVVESCDGQALKPVCPFATQKALDSDLIDQWLTWITFRVECAWHDSVPPAAPASSPSTNSPIVQHTRR